jgi:L-serine deaminase
MFFTGHTDAFNNVNNIVGISSGMAAVSGVAFINGGNYANLIILNRYPNICMVDHSAGLVQVHH